MFAFVLCRFSWIPLEAYHRNWLSSAAKQRVINFVFSILPQATPVSKAETDRNRKYKTSEITRVVRRTDPYGAGCVPTSPLYKFPIRCRISHLPNVRSRIRWNDHNEIHNTPNVGQEETHERSVHFHQ